MKLSAREAVFLVSAMLIAILFGWLIEATTGISHYWVWLVVCFPAGWYSGTMAAKDKKKRARQAWRDAHPGMPDIWLPDHLKEK